MVDSLPARIDEVEVAGLGYGSPGDVEETRGELLHARAGSGESRGNPDARRGRLARDVHPGELALAHGDAMRSVVDGVLKSGLGIGVAVYVAQPDV